MTLTLPTASIQSLIASGALLVSLIQQAVQIAADLAAGVPGAAQAAQAVLQQPPIPQLLASAATPPAVIDGMEVPAPQGQPLTWGEISDAAKQMADAMAMQKYAEGFSMAITILSMAGGAA